MGPFFFFRRESVSFLLKDQDARVLVAFVSYKVWIMEISPPREPQLLCSSYCKHALCMRTTMNPCEGRSDRGEGVYLWTICMQNDGTFLHWKKQIDPTLPPADKVLEFPRHYKPVERQPGAGGDSWFVLRGGGRLACSGPAGTMDLWRGSGSLLCAGEMGWWGTGADWLHAIL